MRDLARGDISLRAMGLVYTTLLSLIPLAAFSFAILKVFGARATCSLWCTSSSARWDPPATPR